MCFEIGFSENFPSSQSIKAKYPNLTYKDFDILNEVLLTKERITKTELDEMPREYHDQYLAILSEIGKGENHKRQVEKAKQQAKSKAKK